MNKKAELPLRQYNLTYQDKPFRVLQEGGETLFVAADVCMAIGLQQVSRSVGWISQSCKKMVKVALVQQPNRAFMMHVIDYIGLEEIMMQRTKKKKKKRKIRKKTLKEIIYFIKKIEP